jgi:aspartate racemase
MTLHIGITACSAEGAALCYRTICVEGARLLGPHAHPEVSMHTPSLAEYVRCLERDDWQGVGALMLASAEKLARIGADFLICPDNTIHQALPLIANSSPLPWCTSRKRSRTRPRHAGSTASGCSERAGS